VAALLLLITPFLAWCYGPDFFSALSKKDPVAVARFGILWIPVLAAPLSVALILGLVKLRNGHLFQVGWTGHRLGRNVLLGVLGFFVLTPAVLGVNSGVDWLWRRVAGEPGTHPLITVLRPGAPFIDWGLGFTAAVILAPATEELLFRGVLQPWLATRPRGGDVGMIAALVLTAYAIGDPLMRATTVASGMIAAAPLVFPLAMLPVYLLLRSRYRSAAVNGIFVAALVFGVAHSSVWPTPIALFLLGIGLGVLAYRTQSIVPSVVTHALFNGLSFLLLAYKALWPAHGQ
jgi:membrane protease YdiL (CAAX protease family)